MRHKFGKFVFRFIILSAVVIINLQGVEGKNDFLNYYSYKIL